MILFEALVLSLYYCLLLLFPIIDYSVSFLIRLDQYISSVSANLYIFNKNNKIVNKSWDFERFIG